MGIAARRIEVVVGGQTSELIEAIGKAQDALKQMADVIAKVSDTSVKANEATLDSNAEVAKSYEDTLATVRDSGLTVVEGLRTQMDAQKEAATSAGGMADEIAGAMDRQVEAMRAVAAQALGMSDDLDTAAKAASEGYGVTADAAEASADRQVEALDAVATAARDAADAQREAAAVTEDSYYADADAADASADKQVEAQGATADAAESSAVKQKAASDANVSSAKKAASSNEAAFAASGSSLVKFGKTVALTAAGVAAGSLYMAAKFEASNTRLMTQAGATQKQVSQIGPALKKMMGDIGEAHGGKELQEGMYHIVSSMNAVLPAAHRTSEELTIMSKAAELAKVGNTGIAETSYVVGSAMNALHMRANRATEAVGQLNAIVGAGDMTLQDLEASMKSGVLPTAQAFGLSLQSIGAALDVFGDEGIRGAQAGTKLRMAIALIGAPTKAAAKDLETIGLSSKEAISDSTAMSEALTTAGVSTTRMAEDLKRPDGLAVALRDLKDHLESAGLSSTGAAATITRAFGGGRTGAGIMLLEQNLTRLEDKYKQIGRTGGEFGEDWAKTQETFSNEVDKAAGALEAFGITIGQDEMPVAKEFVKDLKDSAEWLEHNRAAAEALAAIVAGGLSVAVAAFVANKLAKMAEGLKQVGGAFRYLESGFGTAASSSVARGAGGTSIASELTGAGGIGGIRTPGTMPGTVANPLATVLMSGEAEGLSAGQTAAIGQKTEEGAEQEATSATSEAPAAEEALAGGGLVASLKGIAGPLLANAMKGGLLAGGGVLASQIAGSAIGGTAGHDVSSIGTGASIGAGVGTVVLGPGVGTAIGAAIGASPGVIHALEGATHAEHEAHAGNYKGGPKGSVFTKAEEEKGRIGTWEEDQTKTPTRNDTAAQRAAIEKWNKDIFAQGQKQIGELEGKAESSYVVSGTTNPSIESIIRTTQKQLEGLSPMAREGMAGFIKSMVETLEKEERLPKDSLQKVLDALHPELADLPHVAASTGQNFAKELAANISTEGAREKLAAGTKEIVGNWAKEYKLLPVTTQMAFGEIEMTVTSDMAKLAYVMGHGTKRQREEAAEQYRQIKGEWQGYVHDASDAIATELENDPSKWKTLSQKGSQAIIDAFSSLPEGLKQKLLAGEQTVTHGIKNINSQLESELGSLGVSKSTAKALVTGKNETNLKASPFGAAQGAYLQLGNAGERGHDSIPFMAGGMPVVGAPGETVAVFTHQQQEVANQALAHVGGLPGLFNAVSSPHYMATGGLVGGGGMPAMIAKADAITAHKYPYLWGGGHNASFTGPYDCSGAVSAVLHAGGYLNAPEVASQFMTFGAPGPGPVTIYASPSHVYMSLDGRFFGTSLSNPGGGADWFAGAPRPGFVQRHIDAKGALEAITTPKAGFSGVVGSIAQAVLNQSAAAANKDIQAQLSQGQYGGGDPGETAHGAYNRSALEGLWKQADGPAGVAHLMAAIALAESAGNPNASNPSGAEGLWQIKGQLVPGNIFNPLVNARNAVAKYRSQGLGAWATYTSGAYRRYLARGGLVRAFARGGFLNAAKGRTVYVPKPAAPKHAPLKKTGQVKNIAKGKTVSPSVNNMLRKLKEVPGMASLAGEESEVAQITALGNTQSMLSNIEGLPDQVFIQPQDLTEHLNAVMVPGEPHFTAGMSVTAAQRVQQEWAARSKSNESLTVPLTEQGEILGWLAELPSHHTLTPGDVANLASSAGPAKLTGFLKAGMPQATAAEVVYGWEINKNERLQGSVGKLRQLVHTMGVQLKARQAQIKKHAEAELKRYAKIKNHIKGLTTGTLAQRLAAAEDTKAKTELLADAGESKAAIKEDIEGEKTLPKAQRSETAINDWKSQIAHIEDYERTLRNKGSAAKDKESVQSAYVALEKNALTNELGPIGEKLRALTGSSTTVGTSGRYGEETKYLSKVEGAVPTLEQTAASLVQTIPQLHIELEKLKSETSDADLKPAPPPQEQTGETAQQAALNAILKEELQQVGEKLAYQTASNTAISSLVAQIPHYDQGGPVIADSLAMVHRGEHVVPRDGALVMQGGGAPPHVTVEHHTHVHGDAAGLIRLIDDRVTHPKNVQHISRQVSQRTHLLSGRNR